MTRQFIRQLKAEQEPEARKCFRCRTEDAFAEHVRGERKPLKRCRHCGVSSERRVKKA